MDSKRTTLQDLAKKLGVSHTTVALALRNHHRISIGRREEVRRLAEEMGYRPDPFLSGLAAYRRKNIHGKFQGVIAWVNHWKHPARLREVGEFEAYWQGATKAVERFGYRLEDIAWPADCSAQRFEKILVARGILGVLIPPHHHALDWGAFEWGKFSMIRFGMSVHNPDSNLVTTDQHRAVVMALTKIHEYGYKRIGFVLEGELDRTLGGNYFGGFAAAQKLLGLDPALPPLLASGEIYRTDPARELKTLERWLKKHRPDAILTTEAQLPDLIRKLGYRVPRDIAIAGTSVRDLPLDAGIDQHSEAIGRIAVEMLVKQININERGEPSDPCRILVESRWQDGKSLPRRT